VDFQLQKEIQTLCLHDASLHQPAQLSLSNQSYEADAQVWSPLALFPTLTSCSHLLPPQAGKDQEAAMEQAGVLAFEGFTRFKQDCLFLSRDLAHHAQHPYTKKQDMPETP